MYERALSDWSCPYQTEEGAGRKLHCSRQAHQEFPHLRSPPILKAKKDIL
jgi:hypothetical protein